MHRVSRCFAVALSPLLFLAVAAPSPAPVDPTYIDPGFVIEIEDRRTTNLDALSPFDGTRLTGGFLGPIESGCPAGVQGFFFLEDLDENLVCERYGHAATGCTGTGSSGDSLFGDLTNVYQEFVESRSVTASAVEPNSGDIYLAVNVRVAWRTIPDDELAAAFSTVLLQLDANCNVISGLYLGPTPDGIPDNGTMTCNVLCAALAVEEPQYAIEALSFEHGVLAFTGWFRDPTRNPTVGATKDLLIGKVQHDLGGLVWMDRPAYVGNDVGLDLAISVSGEVFVTGFHGEDRDMFAARYGPNGVLRYAALAGGPLDDQGNSITLTDEGEVVVSGYFSDSASFGNQVVMGAGPTEFVATYTLDLQLLSIAVPDPSGNNGTDNAAQVTGPPLLHAPDAPPSDPTSRTGPQDIVASVVQGPGVGQPTEVFRNSPFEVELIKGSVGSSSQSADWVAQVRKSEDVHLHLYGEPVEGSDEAINITRYRFLISELKTRIRTFKLEVRSTFCNVLTIELARGDGGGVHTLPMIEICPLDEPVITVAIPGDVSAALDFAATGGGVLDATVHMSLNGSECQGICISSNGKDSCVDEVEVGTDY